jgi:molybdopterin-biosynthesis enzyme MoeA-like protein
MGNVFVLAGIPVVMQSMYDSLQHMLAGGAPVKSRAIRISLGEGTIAQGLSDVQARYPDVEIGSYPSARAGRLGVSLVFRSTDPARIAPAVDEVKALVRALGDTPEDEPMDAEAAG